MQYKFNNALIFGIHKLKKSNSCGFVRIFCIVST